MSLRGFSTVNILYVVPEVQVQELLQLNSKKQTKTNNPTKN